MKYIFFAILVCLSAKAGAQNAPGTGTQKPDLQIAGNYISPNQAGSASLQSANWQLEVKSNPSNAKAWFNYYLWTERDKSAGSQNKLFEIINEASKNISERSLYYLMLYLRSGASNEEALLKAEAMGEDNEILAPYLVRYYLSHDQPTLKKYCESIEAAKPLSPSLYKYHFNVLMSANSAATIFGKGLNDLVPMAILQQVYHVRTDIHLFFYHGKMDPNENSYFCLSMGSKFISGYPHASYTGLLIKLSATQTFDELKNNIETRFNLDQQQFNSTDAGTIELQKNYLPSFILLYRYYVKEGNQKQYALKAIIDKIAALSGLTASVQEAMMK